MLDVCELLEDRLAVFPNPVLVLPLEEADPDDYRSEFVGVELGFDAEELRWRNHLGQDEGDALLGGEACASSQRSSIGAGH